ncbi:MAG: pyridoxamine 5'-phosphate oxidase family protein [Alistipes sp.]|nr:pyridoxamine 5'-phosphate oxidase family protein [Alistipes sp.]
MRYDNGAVRRQDRLLSEERALELLLSGEYGFLAMASDDGGYGVPVNYAVDGNTIYVHCAPEGAKLRAIANDERVMFCVVGQKRIVPAEFTTMYESVMAQGSARLVDSEAERREALRMIVEKYSPEHREKGMAAIERSISRTAVIAIDVHCLTGKQKSR